MPSDEHNSITAKVTGLIFSLFNVASAREVPFGIPQYVHCILHGLTGVLHSSLVTVKSVNLAVVSDGCLHNGIVHIFHSGYFNCRDTFQIVLDS